LIIYKIQTKKKGGVGPMTVAMLMKNTVQSAQRVAGKLIDMQWNIRSLPLKLQKPVPRYVFFVSYYFI
jgi:methylenetetrahydrofolate dehydrogenase (NADP+) / methenyltetrahydrofolate cyclohydrolase / formyltetrahydrofolate synthetase